MSVSLVMVFLLPLVATAATTQANLDAVCKISQGNTTKCTHVEKTACCSNSPKKSPLVEGGKCVCKAASAGLLQTIIDTSCSLIDGWPDCDAKEKECCALSPKQQSAGTKEVGCCCRGLGSDVTMCTGASSGSGKLGGGGAAFVFGVVVALASLLA